MNHNCNIQKLEHLALQIFRVVDGFLVHSKQQQLVAHEHKPYRQESNDVEDGHHRTEGKCDKDHSYKIRVSRLDGENIIQVQLEIALLGFLRSFDAIAPSVNALSYALEKGDEDHIGDGDHYVESQGENNDDTNLNVPIGG